MKPNQLPALLCAAAIASCAPKRPAETLLPEALLPAVEQDLLQQYRHGEYGFLLYQRTLSALGTDLGTVNIYKDYFGVNDAVTYSISAESEVSPARTLSSAEDYLEDIVENYQVSEEEVGFVAGYFEGKVDAAEPERLGLIVRYAVGQSKGVILAYDPANAHDETGFLAGKLISPALALSILHFCSVEMIGYDTHNTVLESDYDLSMMAGKVRFVETRRIPPL